jgi:hypothetical protein
MRSKDNAQYMVGIPRDSDMHRFYQEEATSQGVKLPTHIYQLLKDRYEALQGSGQAIWFPRGAAAPPVLERPKPQGKVETALAAFGGEDED